MIDLDDVIDQDWLFSHRDLMLVTRDGLGDHFVAAGLAGWMAQRANRVFVTCQQYNWPSIDWLYRSLPNVIPVGMSRDSNWKNIVELCQQTGIQVCRSFLDFPVRTGQPWFRACYSQYGLDYDIRWHHAPALLPGLGAERLYKTLVTSSPYAVIHDHSSECPRYDLDLPRELGEQVPVIKIDSTFSNNIFDWLTILRGALQIHLVESSVFTLCEADGANLQGQVFFHHKRAHSSFDFERDIKPFNPKWQCVDYAQKQ